MKKYIYITFAMLFPTLLFSQHFSSTPSNSGPVLDTGFECYASNVGLNNCVDMALLSCPGLGNWNSTGTIQVCGYDAVTPFNGSMYCSLSPSTDIDGNVTLPTLGGFLTDLTVGFTYEYDLTYANLSPIDPAFCDCSVRMIVNMGENTFYTLIPPPSANQNWMTTTFSFCPPVQTIPVSISFDIPDLSGDQQIKIAIDDFDFKRKPGLCTQTCATCSSFQLLEPNKNYILSAWVKEADQSGMYASQVTTYDSRISVKFGTDDFIYFSPSGQIIDGWQRITGTFTTPADPADLDIALENVADGPYSFFDDIRIFPADGSMKSFVYDQVNRRLMAELDDNNYATFYEYDAEGGLVRVKKETEKGIYTIQETRSNTSKK